MANEGTLNLDCIATDPNSEYLYGIASANTNLHTNYADSHIVLVRSNLNPINLTNMTWSVVSSSTSSELSYNYPTFTSVDCAVSEKGDFTAFVRSPYRVFSETTIIPMGVRYIRESGIWSNIYGSAVYGWISDTFVHKSFYFFHDLIHMVTGDDAFRMRTGILDTSTNSLRLVSSSEWYSFGDSYGTFPEDGRFGESANFNYTRQGFFSRNRSSRTRMIAFAGNEIYLTPLPWENNGDFATFSYSQNVGLGSRVIGPFKGPPESFHPHYLFGGLYRVWGVQSSDTTTFFGGIGEIDGVYKLYTTVRSSGRWNQSYVEHDIIRSDTSADFTVHENLQTVGGGIQDHQAFVVALTSKGLYEFEIFGPDAGKMKGPYNVVVLEGFNSLPSRVVTTFKNGTLRINMMSSAAVSVIIGAVMLVMMVAVGLYERKKFNKDKSLPAEKKSGAANDGGDVYSMGVIPEDQSRSMPYHSTVHVFGTFADTASLSMSTVTYQDQISDLEFSSHPRPNIVTTVGDNGGVA